MHNAIIAYDKIKVKDGKMIRLYYITLSGEYQGRYVEIYARDKDRAVWNTERVFGVMNVSTVYTAKAWRKKSTENLISVGKIESEDEREYRRLRR